MKTIKIWFSGLGDNFDPKENYITNILKKEYVVEISRKPDYLFFNEKSKDYLDFQCVRIFMTVENLVPDFNICDYAIGFHYIDFQDRYIRYPVYMIGNYSYYDGDNYALDLERALNKHENAKEQLKNKTEFCAFVYSNGIAVKCREKVFDGLSEYKAVNSGGRYRNNIGGSLSNKLEFQSKHKFVIAFENSPGYGYTTEKIVHAFSAGAIPIYWGNPSITKEFNPESFINCHDFGLTENGELEAIKKIIAEVKRIDQDDKAYLRLLRTPAFRKQDYVCEKQVELEKFLYHIFEQPLEKAYRRNRFYWGERYERKQKIGNAFYLMCRKIIPIRDNLKILRGKF